MRAPGNCEWSKCGTFTDFEILKLVPFVGIKPLGNITAPLHVMDAKVSSGDLCVENTLTHAGSVEHVKLIKVN